VKYDSNGLELQPLVGRDGMALRWRWRWMKSWAGWVIMRPLVIRLTVKVARQLPCFPRYCFSYWFIQQSSATTPASCSMNPGLVVFRLGLLFFAHPVPIRESNCHLFIPYVSTSANFLFAPPRPRASWINGSSAATPSKTVCCLPSGSRPAMWSTSFESLCSTETIIERRRVDKGREVLMLRIRTLYMCCQCEGISVVERDAKGEHGYDISWLGFVRACL